MTVNGTKVQAMPIFDTYIKSLDRESCEEVEFTGSKLADSTTVRRPDINQPKLKCSHTQDERFYMTYTEEHQIHLILRENKDGESIQGAPGRAAGKGDNSRLGGPLGRRIWEWE